jgi:hypothetical protein
MRFVVTHVGYKTPTVGRFAGESLFWVEATEIKDNALVPDGTKIGFAQAEASENGKYRAEVVGAYIAPEMDMGETADDRMFVVTHTLNMGYDGADQSVIGLNRTREGAVDRIKAEFAKASVVFDLEKAQPKLGQTDEIDESFFRCDENNEYYIDSFPIGR